MISLSETLRVLAAVIEQIRATPSVKVSLDRIRLAPTPEFRKASPKLVALHRRIMDRSHRRVA